MESLISVIVPIYNVEKYLNRCIDSIINQTYKNLEIILVDDGSPDNCSKICDEYAKKDSRIKVIHKSNGGLSSARNAGLDIAIGDYITFVDSDDWLDLDAIEVLLKNLIENNANVSVIDFWDSNKEKKIVKRIRTKVVFSNKIIKDICYRKKGTSVCGRLFNKDIFNNRRFEIGKLNEDFLFMTKLLTGNNLKCVYTNYKGYTYFHREGSISSSFGKSLVDAVYNTSIIEKLADEQNKSVVKYFKGYNAYQARTALICMPKEYREEHKDFEKFCVECLRKNLRYAYFKQLKLKDIILCELYIKKPALARKLIGK